MEYTTSTKNIFTYRGLPRNFTNGDAFIVCKNGMKLSCDAYDLMQEIYYNSMENFITEEE